MGQNSGSTDYSGSTFATVLQSAVDALPTGSIQFLGNQLASLTATITVNKHVNIDCNGWTLQAASALNPMVKYDTLASCPERFVGIKNAVLDMNNTAVIGLEVVDCWHNFHTAFIRNVPVNGTGLKLHSINASYLSLYNKFHIKVDGYGVRPAGSIGVLVTTSVGGSCNHNEFTGRITSLDIGFKTISGSQLLLNRLDIGANNTGSWFYLSYGNVALDCYEEGSINEGYLLQNSGSLVLIGGLYEKLTCLDHSKAIFMSESAGEANLDLISKYTAAVGYDTPRLRWSVGGNYTIDLRGLYTGPVLEFKNPNDRRITFEVPSTRPAITLVTGSGGGGEIARFGTGTTDATPYLKMWDPGKGAFMYAYFSNGVWTTGSAEPT